MTAPTINGTRYPQPVDALLPQARQLVDQFGQVPSRNRLMREFRIGAPKADEIRARLAGEQDRQAEADRMRAHLLASGSTVERVELFPAARPVYDYPAPIGPDRAPVDTGGTPGLSRPRYRPNRLRRRRRCRRSRLTDTRARRSPRGGSDRSPSGP